MPILPKHQVAHRDQVLRDVRPATVRIADFWSQPNTFFGATLVLGLGFAFYKPLSNYADLASLLMFFYVRWFYNKPLVLPLKIPRYAGIPDKHNPKPGKGGAGPSDGILYLGNLDEAAHPDHGAELWLTNSDARTHILFLGTTGSGKTEGLKSIIVNALAWSSGFVYVDGKADTDLWASLFALARRFGRDDDLLLLNYMTANSDDGAVSNTMNPFSNGSASYLTNMVVSLMPDAGGDNAMWKERAVALMGALMPALTWKRDKQGLLLDVSVLRDFIELPAIIRLSRDANLPERIIRALQGYLSTLPGYVDAAFDDEGNERPPAPDQPMYDLQVARQQHGYLSMQFTRSLQSLGDEYGYIFKAQLADIDVLDVVLNRRILIALIPALEKSGDEAANLGKIIAASLKGMMGATLGNTVEGSWENAIGSKQTRSSSSFLTVFDEVGYYTAQGMAVMAAQARSLGFSLIFAAQDLPSMEKRVKQEAQSILGNCNLKIFGKLEDPGDTKDFFHKHVGDSFVMENRGMKVETDSISSMFMTNQFIDEKGGGVNTRLRACYDHLRGQREGEVHMLFAEYIVRARMFYAQPEKVQALRVTKMLPIPGTTTMTVARERAVSEIAARLKTAEWKAVNEGKASLAAAPEIAALASGMAKTMERGGKNAGLLETSVSALVGLSRVMDSMPAEKAPASSSSKGVAPASRAAVTDTYADTDTDFVDTDLSTASISGSIGFQSPVYAQTGATSKKGEASSTKSQNQGFGSDLPDFGGSGDDDVVHTSFAPSDLDLGLVARVRGLDDDVLDITQVNLDDDVDGLLKDVADKMNRGLNEDTRAAG